MASHVLPPVFTVLMFSLFYACTLTVLGCASVTVVSPSGQAVEVRPGLRNVAVCFGEDANLREVKAYPISRTLALQNAALGVVFGGVVGAFFGVAPAGAAVGGVIGLASDAIRALGDAAGAALEEEPGCDYPIPPLRPDEAALPPPPKTSLQSLNSARRYSRFPLAWEPLARWHEERP